MFSWNPHQENVIVLGMQGSGKTTLVRRILSSIQRVPRWIWSPQLPTINYQGYGQPVDNINDLKKGAYIYNGEYGPRQFDFFCKKAMEQSNMIIVVDDVQEYVTKQRIPNNFSRLINSGRNRGIVGIYISPSPNLVNNTILQSAQHLFSFKFTLESQIEWVSKSYFGNDAWLLLPPHLRKKAPIIQHDGVLPDHSYLYRKHTDQENTLVLGGQQ